MFRSCLILICLAWMVSGQSRASGGASSGEEVSVLTWNLWGIPWLTPSAPDRVKAALEEVVACSPDLVCLQEVWGRGDVAEVRKTLLAAGYSEVVHFPSWPFGSGLVIASRLPVLRSGFHRFRHQGTFYKPWHGDWYAGKGIGWVEVETRSGERLRVLNTHLHARVARPSDVEYLPTRLVQTVDLVAMLNDLRREGVPVLLCGDLNMKLRELPMHYLRGSTGLRAVVSRGDALDWVMVQEGGEGSLRFMEYEIVRSPVFNEGRGIPVSDHPLVMATVGINGVEERVQAVAGDPGGVLGRVAKVKIRLENARADSQRAMGRFLMASGGFLLVGIVAIRRRQGGRWLRWSWVGVAIGLILTLHFHHYGKALEETLDRLEKSEGGARGPNPGNAEG